MKYRVGTESTAEYIIDFDRGTWFHRDHGEQWLFQFLVAKHDGSIGYPWNSPDEWEYADIPVIGRRMYLTSGKMHGWRISTQVVSVEEVAE